MSARNLANRYGASERLLNRYVSGATPETFTAAERAELRDALMAQPEYRNPNHPNHERLSLDVRDLFLADSGGQLKDAGLGTHVRAGAGSNEEGAADKGSLFSS